MNKLLIAAPLLIAALPMRGQTPPQSFPSAADTFAQPASPSSLTSGASVPVQKVDPAKEQLILQVLARSKEPEKVRERLLQAMVGMKRMMPRVKEKFWDKYRQLISLDELRDRLVYVYDKHYTSEELNDLLKFYDSPTGKKVSDNALLILQESMDIAQELSKRAAQSVAADVQAEQLLQMPGAARSLRSPVLAPSNRTESPAPSPATAPQPQ